MDSAAPYAEPAARTVVSTLLLTDLVGSTKLVEQLGDARSAEVFSRQDRIARDLLREHGGQEIDKTDGYLLLFSRPFDAVLYALDYHAALQKLSAELDVKLAARAGVHLGELIIHENAPEDVARGAKPVEVEGIAKPVAARIMSLAQGGQTLMTQAAFDLARRAVVGSEAAPADTAWMAHGAYLVKGCEEPLDVFEVGVHGIAPLDAPPDSEKARRSVAAADEETLGWRPAANLTIPQRDNWVLDHKLGEGGFGEVWLALHKQTKETRVFKFCFDSEHLRSLKRELTLFRILRDALGDRKDIAKLYEVQLEEAPFFLESEFTPSGSMLEWAESKGGIDQVPLETRIDLMTRTARAVAAAHSVGIIHKDIKPANVLVYEDEDGQPRPRLADFGIGGLEEGKQLEGGGITIAGFSAALSSESGSQAGTRMYAPPETLAGKPFTALGDVYALGVMLYQVVAGDLTKPIAQGWERDLPWPILRCDIAECLEGDETQRMSSAQSLAKRLEALPQRRRAARRRHHTRIAVAVVSVMAVLGVVATGLAFWQGAMRQKAEDERDKANKITALLQEVFASPDAWDKDGGEVLVVDVLDRAAVEFSTSLDDQPEVKAALFHTLGITYLMLDRYDEAKACLEPALKIRRDTLRPPHEDLAQSVHAWAWYLFIHGEYEPAEPLYREALSMRRALAEKSGGDRDDRLELAASLQHLAAWLNKTGKAAEAEPFYTEALEIRRELLAATHRDVGRSLNNLGFCLMKQKKYAEALIHLGDAFDVFRVQHGSNPQAEVAACMTNRARCHMELREYDDAKKLFERAVAMKREVWKEGNVSIAVSLYYLGDLLLRTEEFAAAEQTLGEALAIRRDLHGQVHQTTARTESLLAACLVALDRPAEAKTLLLHAYPILSASSGVAGQTVRATLERLVLVCDKLNEEAEAQKYRELLASAGG